MSEWADTPGIHPQTGHSIDCVVAGRADDTEVDEDLVRDMNEVMMSFCARLYDRRAGAHRAARALASAQEPVDVA